MIEFAVLMSCSDLKAPPLPILAHPVRLPPPSEAWLTSNLLFRINSDNLVFTEPTGSENTRSDLYGIPRIVDDGKALLCPATGYIKQSSRTIDGRFQSLFLILDVCRALFPSPRTVSRS